jgi:hypothetical protein
MSVDFKYTIGDLVRVKDSPDIHGRIVGLCLRIYGETYCFCWWQDGKRLEEWVHDWEVEPIP